MSLRNPKQFSKGVVAHELPSFAFSKLFRLTAFVRSPTGQGAKSRESLDPQASRLPPTHDPYQPYPQPPSQPMEDAQKPKNCLGGGALDTKASATLLKLSCGQNPCLNLSFSNERFSRDLSRCIYRIFTGLTLMCFAGLALMRAMAKEGSKLPTP